MTTLEELKVRMDEIMKELKALQESRPDMEEGERLERAGKLQAEGKMLGDRYRAIRMEQQAVAKALSELSLDSKLSHPPGANRLKSGPGR